MFLYSIFFFFKQKTAYEMRISDWSSDVCSSDLHGEELGQLGVGLVDRLFGDVVARVHEPGGEAAAHPVDDRSPGGGVALLEPEEVDLEDLSHGGNQIGRTSCRESVCQYV